jgi:hypothetical protein
VNDVQLTQEFVEQGGTEFAPMSTPKNLDIALGFAGQGQCSLVLKFEIEGFINLGADIAFLSQHEGEQEYLYPPLTHIRVIGDPKMEAMDSQEVLVVRMVPSFGTWLPHTYMHTQHTQRERTCERERNSTRSQQRKTWLLLLNSRRPSSHRAPAVFAHARGDQCRPPPGRPGPYWYPGRWRALYLCICTSTASLSFCRLFAHEQPTSSQAPPHSPTRCCTC